jgi:hypothetical protein
VGEAAGHGGRRRSASGCRTNVGEALAGNAPRSRVDEVLDLVQAFAPSASVLRRPGSAALW